MKPFAAAIAAGLSPIPVDTRTKRPMVHSWKQYQDKAADLDEIAEWDHWFAQGRCGIAIVCGAVSGRLIALDIEGRFAARPSAGLDEALRAASMFDVFEGWVEGYCERTPNAGLHVLVHVGGDDPVSQNLKLASDAEGGVLIETRGEGGYVIVAPSRNGDRGWTSRRGSLATIAWATAEEWAAMAAVLSSFDESPPPPPAPAVVAPLTDLLRLSESWIDDVKGSLPPIEAVLDSLGFVHVSDDGRGSLWTRPGKPWREGHSVRVNASGRLMVFSTSMPLPASNRTTYDQADVILAYELGRAPTEAERVEFLRAHRPQTTTGGAAGQAAEASPTDGGQAAEASPAASSSVRLDDAFWQSTPWLKALRAAAWARGLAPSGVLGAWLATYAATLPSGIRIPAVGPASAPLNLFCCLVGQSGTGKTATMRLARDLVGPVTNPDILLGRSLRSGEGLIRLARKPQPKSPGGAIAVPSYRNGLLLSVDEAAALGKQAERSGSTLIANLNSVWAGGSNVVGGAKADDDDFFPADLVRVCAVLSVQYGVAGNLFIGEAKASGFPQRLLFFGLRDPQILELERSTRSTAPIKPLDVAVYHASDFTRHPLEIGVPDDICDEVQSWLDNKDHGTGLVDDYDAHLYNNQLRVAAICALADGSTAITELEWILSRQIVDASRQIRGQLLAALGDLALERARAQGLADIAREEVREEAWLAKRGRRLAGWLRTRPDGASRKELKLRLNQLERPRLGEIIDYAIARGWVIHRDGRFFHRGD